MQIKSLSLIGVFSILFPLLTSAQILAGGAVSTATAGSGRASPDSAESTFLNPAAIAFLHGYFISSSYNATPQTSGMNFSIVDCMKDTVVPTAIGYEKYATQFGNGAKTNSQDLRLALGEKFPNGKVAGGFSIHHRADETPQQSYNQNNLSLSTAGYLTDNLSFGMVLDDLLPTGNSVPEVLRLETQTSVGMAYTFKRSLRARVDYLTGTNNKFAKPTVLSGLEAYMNRFVVFRAGLGHNFELNNNIFATGIGFQGPKFGVHYAYLQGDNNVNPARHVIDLSVPVW